jgi:hypothetical protein
MSANLEVFVFESLQKICDAAAKTKELKLLQDQSKKLIGKPQPAAALPALALNWRSRAAGL